MLVGSMCVFQSCNNDDDDDYAMSNQDFVVQASSSNRFEIMAGEVAVTKGQSDTVTMYGQHMVTDHTAAQAELAMLASTKGIGLPEGLLTHHASNLNTLENNTSQELFDRRFAEFMVLSHQEAVNLFSLASRPNGVPDPEIRAWAASKLPALQMHLEHAVELYNVVTD